MLLVDKTALQIPALYCTHRSSYDYAELFAGFRHTGIHEGIHARVLAGTWTNIHPARPPLCSQATLWHQRGMARLERYLESQPSFRIFSSLTCRLHPVASHPFSGPFFWRIAADYSCIFPFDFRQVTSIEYPFGYISSPSPSFLPVTTLDTAHISRNNRFAISRNVFFRWTPGQWEGRAPTTTSLLYVRMRCSVGKQPNIESSTCG